jgi:predicted transcriptional regulator
MDLEQPDLAALTADIVSSFVSGNHVAASELPGLIASVHGALSGVGTSAPVSVSLVPAVSIKKSVTPDYIISLENGRKFKSLKRYLRTSHNLSPDEYRKKWGLPADYPMVAPNYAAARSQLAKKLGLGRKPAPAPSKGRTPAKASTKGRK